MPPGLLPIASDPMGNQVCIGIARNNLGRIFGAFLAALYQWEDPGDSDLDKAIKKGDLPSIIRALDGGLPLEAKDGYDQTLIERAAIHAHKRDHRIPLEAWGGSAERARDRRAERRLF